MCEVLGNFLNEVWQNVEVSEQAGLQEQQLTDDHDSKVKLIN